MPLSLLRKSFQTMLKDKPRKSQDNNHATLSTVLSDRPIIDRNYVLNVNIVDIKNASNPHSQKEATKSIA